MKNAAFCLIQPPFVQLNSPYPALYYLRSFLEQKGHTVYVRDHSISLFASIFCRKGLARIFADVKKLIAARDSTYNPVVEHFISDEDRWLSCIDRLIAFLRGSDHEWGHFAALVNGTLPGGPRFHNYLVELYAHDSTAETADAALLASKLLADIADFITQTLDANFALVRYVPSTGGGFRDFSAILKNKNGYIMRNFYRPLLEAEWRELSGYMPDNFYLGLTIPFPGCLTGSLVCAQSAKAFFGDKITVIAGGGYVNTELRYLADERVFDYFDYLSFDRGYGSLDAILTNNDNIVNNNPLYKTMYRGVNGGIIKDNSINHDTNNNNSGKYTDDEAVLTTFPDYAGVDFSCYIRPVDDANPMHRLWSDGRWLKAYLAHGCYWRKCSFCDTSLDYIKCYQPVDVDALFRHLLEQARVTGIRGVHLVDEACPPASLLRLALLNREAGLPLVFWGNIRFEKNFTRDTAAILAAGGLIGVSAGLEVVLEQGLARIGKGIDPRGVVNVCAAFKEAGILTHAYCIYGYWDQDAQEIVDSAEVVRQLFAEGLLDSAFWHQFTLTKHSRVYAEQQKGLHPRLQAAGDPLRDTARENAKIKNIFALNDLSFAGEQKFSRYDGLLSGLLDRWIHGDYVWPDDEKLARRSVSPDLVKMLLENYYTRADKADKAAPPLTAQESFYVIFLGSKPRVRSKGTNVELGWYWRFEDCSLRLGAGQARETIALLETAAGGTGLGSVNFCAGLEAIFGNDTKRVWKKLRQRGLMLW